MNRYIILFSSFLRPAVILVCAMLLFNLPTLIYKIGMFLRGILYLAFCNDKSWKKPQDPILVVGPMLAKEKETGDSTNLERKTIYFVRHGESTWNDTFNKGSHRSAAVFAIGFIPGLIKALLFELYLILSGKLDSWFYDSPASNLGLSQVKDLASFMKQAKTKDDTIAQHIAILKASPDAPPSKIICSSLRRAVTTMAGGFKDRLSRRPSEKVLIVPALQEISRNPDALSITPAHTQIQASWIDKTSELTNFQATYINQVDMSLHDGNKPLGSNGLKRMRDFCQFVFSPSCPEDFVVAGGHSIWFRSFFKTFLPYGENHPGKNKKIINCGIVALTLIKATRPSGQATYMIDPNSVEVIYGGFH
ncbi:histidine phosphatase superfamily branch 1 protein [Nitzschia inconspicua]|uniref:Histidine phosphatase superfamily branch 1 protein n=1 Tax=Nitzschia inconspicua TaxID=303405 RepID=A0A9K3KI70_9STRA|nr:histidine phosphatase superfamily branch 1 protein [Nitzschia inconspicua]